MHKKILIGLFKEAEREGLIFRKALISSGRRLRTDDKTEYINFSTTSYLGLEFDCRCIKAVETAMYETGIFFYSSPIFLRSPYQVCLEKKIADVVNYPDISLFSSVTLLNMGVLPAITPDYGCVVVDEFVHQSVYDGLAVARCKRIKRYRNCDPQHLEYILKRNNEINKPPLVITDGVFSMSGNIAPLETIAEHVLKRNGLLYVDDSHGFGVLGEKGEGLAQRCSRTPCKTIYVGSMNKALAAPVCFVAGAKEDVQNIRWNAHTAVFSGSVSVPMIAGAIKGLEISTGLEGKKLRAKLNENRVRLSNGLKSFGFGQIHAGCGIVSIELNDIEIFKSVCKRMHAHKIAFNPLTFPAVPQGKYLIRFSISALHTKQDVEHVLMAVKGMNG